ncbi:Signal transduction histidine kinase [Streptomyces sp. yr375]|uniref:ATP-binding protein n=1 Tax=Streptomyces sp. yr375 TaxID=1761906 RepID=UPI0008AFC7F8|nr:ATP-binding protein [Streptomyces sp. yr375]SEP58916.1 Signal transduction histidine kinase [Streptomyces sp. yr375]
MSHLRAPATRADRREGGRHGRPVARTAPAPAETHIRPQLLRLAVLPPTAVALSACAVVLFTVRSTGVRPGPMLWVVLAGAVAVTGVGIVIAAVAADRAARSVSDRVAALRQGSARGEADLRAVIEALRRGEAPPQRTSRGGPPAHDADDFELLAADLARAHDGAVTAVVQAAQLSSQAGSEQKLEVFVNLARRLQSLVHREISILDELEHEIEDPDLLKGLFHVDHLATRIRRHAENLAVLGGAVSRRQWSNPVCMTEVLRSAIAEVEQYSRVKLVPPIDGELRGHAVADVIHLLAELVENATVFSAPHTQVLLRANLVTSGLAVEVEDRGLGMPVEEQVRMNALLADPDQVNVGRLLADGRIGLFVVSQLARRHGIRVRLQSNIYGGVQAVLVVPQALLGSPPGIAGSAQQGPDTDGTGFPLLPTTANSARPVLPPAPHPTLGTGPTAAGPGAGAAQPPAPTHPQGPRTTPGGGRRRSPTQSPDTTDTGHPPLPPRTRAGGRANADPARPPMPVQARDTAGAGWPAPQTAPVASDAGESQGSAQVHGGTAEVAWSGDADVTRDSAQAHGDAAAGWPAAQAADDDVSRPTGSAQIRNPGDVGESRRSAQLEGVGDAGGAQGASASVPVPVPVPVHGTPDVVWSSLQGADEVSLLPGSAQRHGVAEAGLSHDSAQVRGADVAGWSPGSAQGLGAADSGVSQGLVQRLGAGDSGGSQGSAQGSAAGDAGPFSGSAQVRDTADVGLSYPTAWVPDATAAGTSTGLPEGGRSLSDTGQFSDLPQPQSPQSQPEMQSQPQSQAPLQSQSQFQSETETQHTPASGVPFGSSRSEGVSDVARAGTSPQARSVSGPGRRGGFAAGAAEAAPLQPDAPRADPPRADPPRADTSRADIPRPNGRRPAPLPVRGARETRANPSEAVPGVRGGDRHVVEENAGIAPTPRIGAVRGTMGKPQLPRRRAQEHIVPQLRGGPAPRQDSEQPVAHDPGLMAAFQRGIGLAEAQQSLEGDVTDPPPHPLPYPAYGAPDALDLTGTDQPTARHDGSTPAG